MLSKPVLVGYITGVGLTLLSSQIASFTGVRVTSDRFFPRFRELLGNLGEVQGATCALAAGTLVIIVGLRRAMPRVPGALVGVVSATAIVALFALHEHGIAVVGSIPRAALSIAPP